MNAPSAAPRTMATFVGVTVVWFALAFAGGASGVFERTADEPPWRVGLAAVVPVLVAGLALLLSRGFRAWVNNLDLNVLINLQGLRSVGLSFLALYAYDLLPGGFAWPAGLGDLAVALTAPFVAWHVLRHGQAARAVFLGWTAFGLLDFIVAVALGMAHGLGATDGVANDPVAAPMAHLPMSLIPTFAVPFLFVVHLLAVSRFRAER